MGVGVLQVRESRGEGRGCLLWIKTGFISHAKELGLYAEDNKDQQRHLSMEG